MKFANLKISTRLWLSFGVTMLIMAAIMVTGVMQMQEMDAAFDNVQRAARNDKLAAEIGEGINNMRRYQLSALVSTGAERMKELDRVTAQGKGTAKLAAELEKTQRGVDTKKIAGELVALNDKYAHGNEQVVKLAREDKVEEMKALVQGEERKAQRAAIAEVEKFQAIQESRRAAAEKRAEQVQAQAEKVMYFLMAGALLLAIAMAFLITRSIGRSVAYAVASVEQMARGDLTAAIEVTSQDEIGRLVQSLKDMNASLGNIVAEVRNGSESVSTAAEQIATGNQELSARTEQQASSLEETAASMEELASTVRQNAENAKQATQLAVSASDLANKGGEAVERVVKTMQEIQSSSKKISDIIGVIDGIAFQTNILALNASVEAARAGEQGRGFAVVASEVRNLAQRSATAAKEIKGLITDSVQNVNAGSEQVSDAGSTIGDVVKSVRKVSDLISEIAAATNEQSAGITQVNEAVTQLDKVTQQNAQLVDESANASENARRQAVRLTEAVSVFKVGAQPLVLEATPAAKQVAKPASPAKLASPAVKPSVKVGKQPARARSAAGEKLNDKEWAEF